MEKELLLYKDLIKERLENEETLYKKALIYQYGLSERFIRLIISDIAKELPIISLSHQKGYRLATQQDEIEIRKQIKELTSRQEKLELRKRPLREKLISITGGLK